MIAAAERVREQERQRHALLHCTALLLRVLPLLRSQWEISALVLRLQSTRGPLMEEYGAKLGVGIDPDFAARAGLAEEELRVVIARCGVVLAEIEAVSQ